MPDTMFALLECHAAFRQWFACTPVMPWLLHQDNVSPGERKNLNLVRKMPHLPAIGKGNSDRAFDKRRSVGSQMHAQNYQTSFL